MGDKDLDKMLEGMSKQKFPDPLENLNEIEEDSLDPKVIWAHYVTKVDWHAFWDPREAEQTVAIRLDYVFTPSYHNRLEGYLHWMTTCPGHSIPIESVLLGYTYVDQKKMTKVRVEFNWRNRKRGV